MTKPTSKGKATPVGVAGKTERDDLRQALADHALVYLQECALRFASSDAAIREDGRARLEAVCNLIGEHLDLQLWNQTLAEVNKSNATKPRAKRVDHDEVIAQFKRLCREGHTPREARGILGQRGLASQATIHRITKSIR